MVSRYNKYKKSYVNYRKKNKDKIHTLRKKYRKENREALNQQSLEWFLRRCFGGNREKALERDNWTCQNCGMNNEQHILIFGRQITVDHIDGKGRNSKEKNNDLSNLMTLCLRCHGRKDKLRGKIGK